MAKLLTPDDLKAADKEKELLGNEHFHALYGGLSLRNQKLVMLTLTRPDLNAAERVKAAGFKVPASGDVSRFYRRLEGKLGPALWEFGITETDVADVIRQGLTAMRSMPVKGVDGSIKLLEIPDVATRLKTAFMLTKLGGYYPQPGVKKIEHEHHVLPIEKQIQGKSLEEIRDLIDRSQRGEAIEAEFEVVSGGSTAN